MSSIALFQACASSSDTALCITGETQECTCTTGEKGAQICKGTSDGWGECVCETPVDQNPIEAICRDVDCTEHGSCVVAMNGAVCFCRDGYVSSVVDGKPTCVEGETNPPSKACNNVQCDNHGTCVETANGAACLCHSGYESSVNDNGVPTCKPVKVEPNTCQNVTCGDHGQCISTTAGAICLCHSGYESGISEDGVPTCNAIEVAPDICQNISCGDHGACIETKSGAACLCHSGYESSIDEDGIPTCNAIETEPDACQNITCGDHGQCFLTAAGAACLCDSGYESGVDENAQLTCKEILTTSVCDAITCSGKGTCIETAVGAACLCDTGYQSSTGSNGKPTCTETSEAESPCQNVSCSSKGVCIVTVDQSAYCLCNAGYKANGLNCVEDNDTVCADVDCTAKGVCVDASGTPYCLCAEGYIQTVKDGKPTCMLKEEAPNLCEGITCNGAGSCVESSSGALCVCGTGYESSIVAGKPTCKKLTQAIVCDGVTCSGHGTCLVTGSNTAQCLCDAGYVNGTSTTCVESTTPNPCKDVTCSGHGTCLITGSNTAQCLCDAGYVNGTSTTCVTPTTPNPCKDVTCSGHGSCIVTGSNTAQCLCDDGYTNRTATACEQIPSPCEGVNCGSHGQCVVTSSDIYCLCDIGYVNGTSTTCVESTTSNPCKDVTCSDHGTCVVTGQNTPYCLCNAGYEQGTATTCTESTTANPCKDVTCSAHGICLVTAANTAYCACDNNYHNDGADKCVPTSSTSDLAYKNAFPSPVVDPWGLIWDSEERPALSQKDAENTCAFLGGRLPTATEVYRNNHSTGEKGVPNSNNTIWTMGLYSSSSYYANLSTGEIGSRSYSSSTTYRYRCVWDPDSETRTSLACHGGSTEERCIKIQVGKLTYIVDRYNRPARNISVAAEECRLSGGRLPTMQEMVMLIRNGLPNGTGDLVLSENYFYYSSGSYRGIPVHKWSGTGTASYNNISYGSYGTNASFRCISEEVALEDGNPVFPQAKAAEAFVVDPILRIDKTPRDAATALEASYNCMLDGGHVARQDELKYAERKGLAVASDAQTGTPYGYDSNEYFLKVGNTSEYYSNNSAYPYYCAYRPNRVYDEADFEKEVSEGSMWKYTQTFGDKTVKYFVADKSDDLSGADAYTNAITAANKGMRIPTYHELVFAIRNGLPGGTNNYLMTSTPAGWHNYRTVRWSGTKTKSYTPVYNSTFYYASYSATNGYRAFISSTIQ